MTATKELQQVPEAIIADDAGRYMQLVHDKEKLTSSLQQAQDDCKEMLQQLADSRKEIDRLTAVILVNSTKIEGQKRYIEKLQRLFKSLRQFFTFRSQQRDTSNMHLFKLLDEKEGEFDMMKRFASCEIGIDYLDAAKYCDRYFKRNWHRVEEVEEWLRSQGIVTRSYLFDNFKNIFKN